MVHDCKVLRGVDLQCDRENREHLNYLRSVKCVMTNHSKINIRTRELATKPQTN